MLKNKNLCSTKAAGGGCLNNLFNYQEFKKFNERNFKSSCKRGLYNCD